MLICWKWFKWVWFEWDMFGVELTSCIEIRIGTWLLPDRLGMICHDDFQAIWYLQMVMSKAEDDCGPMNVWSPVLITEKACESAIASSSISPLALYCKLPQSGDLALGFPASISICRWGSRSALKAW